MEDNYEQEARKQGWTEKEGYKGDPEKWVSAQEFVERGEKIAGIATSRAKKFEEKVDELTKTVDELQSANEEFGRFHRKTVEKAEEENAALLEKLKAQRAEAIDNGDGQTYNQVDEEIHRLQSPQPIDAREQQWAKDWASENKWYANDKEARIMADGLASELSRDSTLQGREFMDEVSRRTQEAMPHKFENPKRQTSVTSGSSESDETATPTEKTYDALPSAAKAACDRFVKAGTINREEYVNQYEW